ncbi:MAG: peptide-methionine (S)-S-oxide reductase MsrA [Candidatus Nanopelagicales bacterium]
MHLFSQRLSPSMITPEQSLPGRAQRPFDIPATHAVLGTPLECPNGFPADLEKVYVGMGCFWGAERRLWRLPGVYTTAVGYQGGYTPNPTYSEVCTGRTGHAESVLVVYDPKQVPFFDILKVFWENHDPTQGYRQGNDVGTQYRSALYWTTPAQEELARATAQQYQAILTGNGLDPITTELAPAAGRDFYYAEAEHQQYLHKNPHGYDCHANTGYALPEV